MNRIIGLIIMIILFPFVAIISGMAMIYDVWNETKDEGVAE